MILTCEDCHTRYLLPTHLLGADGRRVRCTICGHEWYQIPEEDGEGGDSHSTWRNDDADNLPIDDIEDADLDLDLQESEEDISFSELLRKSAAEDSVKESLADDRMLASDVIPPEKKSWRQPGLAQGVLAALLTGLVILALLVIARGPVMNLWPNSLALYQLIGLEPPIPGEGLVFEDLKATTSYNAQGVEILRLTGTVRNLRDYPLVVPGLRFALRRADGSEVETWSYPSPDAKIEAGGTIPLSAEYPQIAADVKELNVKFINE